MNREESFKLLLRYNKGAFHVQHAITVGKVMEWYAKKLGHDADYWGIVGLLHDLDYEMYPKEHCIKSAEILRSEGYTEDFIHAVCSHGYNLVNDIQPVHEMEKVLYATDELSGLIGAAARMRPSGSVSDMELKSLKKKFKDKAFAAGCSRDVIQKGAEMLGWDLDKLLSMTLDAMRDSESGILAEMADFKLKNPTAS